MTDACEKDFELVDEIVASLHESKGVDAFSLALLRAERQMRRLFTYLVFQSKSFDGKDVKALRDALGAQRSIYFHHFEVGIDELAGLGVDDLIGAQHQALRKQLSGAMEARNKIFHGQLTSDRNSTAMLLKHVDNIREWCRELANATHKAFGYDGFRRPSSFKKAPEEIQLSGRVTRLLPDISAYHGFLDQLAGRRT